MPERGLQRLQAIELLGELVAFPALLLVGHVFLGVLDHASELRDVELVHGHRDAGEHGQAGRAEPGTSTWLTFPENRTFSGETRSKWKVAMLRLPFSRSSPVGPSRGTIKTRSSMDCRVGPAITP